MNSPQPRATFHFINLMRFVSAMWVIFSHIGLPSMDPLVAMVGMDSWAPTVRRAFLLPFNGVAAVMTFFVISGFCIHYPFLLGRPFEAGSFLVQRFVRIGVPLAAAYGLHMACGTMEGFSSIVWSIYCEIIYYVLYPVLRYLMQRLGAGRLLMGSTVVSWLFCLLPEKGQGHLQAYGNTWTWLLCLPAWLCGCMLAEWVTGTCIQPPFVRRVTAMIASGHGLLQARLMVWILSSVLLALSVTGIVASKYSMPAFAFVVLIWFTAELSRPGRENWAAKAGVMGYSLYLIHPLERLAGPGFHPGMYPLMPWALKLTLALGASIMFYLVIESPSHRLARALARRQARPG